MSEINIVLVEPEIPQNTGNIARTCSATGAALHLVQPMGFVIDDRKLKRAGLDYWNTLEIYMYESLADFMEKHGNDNLWFYTTKASRLYTEAKPDENGEIYLVFGKESHGLPEPLLDKNYDRCIRIPMLGFVRSLNLSNAVAVVAYEVLRQLGYPNLSDEGHLTGRPD